jgi:hypothetical protein
MKFPVDFDALSKLPKPAMGGGYPVQIKGADLMRNYKYAALQVDSSEVNGLKLEEVAEGETRKVRLVPGEVQAQTTVDVTWYDGDGERIDSFVIVSS